MELLQFRYFLEAARYENLTRAADELHIAQPALSQSIMRLENELGVKLFDRRNHHVYLNDQGKLFKEAADPFNGIHRQPEGRAVGISLFLRKDDLIEFFLPPHSLSPTVSSHIRRSTRM